MKTKFKLFIAAALALVLIPVSVFSASATAITEQDDGSVHFPSADLAGDVNEDGVVDIRDLVSIKMVWDGNDISYNALNAELDEYSLAINGGDLAALSKILLGITA